MRALPVPSQFAASLVIAILAASLADAAPFDRTETRELLLDAGAIRLLAIEAGSGSLAVTGDPAIAEVSVTATIRFSGRNEEKARASMQDDMTLTLESAGDRAVLRAFFESGFWNWGNSPAIDLEVRVPERLDVTIEDGSGAIRVSDVRGNLEVDDGSGSMILDRVGGNVEIEDGSGSIRVDGASGDLRIEDGSGSIKVSNVAGSVFIDDGSGGIDVTDVSRDLIVEDDGSGGLRYARVLGRVEAPDE